MDLVFSLPTCNHWKGQEPVYSGSVQDTHSAFYFIYDTDYSKVFKDYCIKEKAANFSNKKSIFKHFIDTSKAL